MVFSTATHPNLVTLRRALSAGTYVSGEQLARMLGKSRTAVWKELGKLRALGYGLEGSPRRGYRLASVPDVPYPWELAALGIGSAGGATSLIGASLVYHPTVGSTNDVARTLAEEGCPEGTVVVADRQTRGRGRRGRQWLSPPGGLWFSVVLRPSLHPSRCGLMPLAAAVAVAQALEGLCRSPLSIKWPNDVLLGGRKVCGILAELSADHETVRYVVLGVGINVDPPPLAGDPPPTGLRAHGCSSGRTAVLAAVLARLEAAYRDLHRQGPEWLVAEADRRLAWKGEPVRVDMGSTEIEGLLVGLERDSAALLVRTGSGEPVRVWAGDVSLRPAERAARPP